MKAMKRLLTAGAATALMGLGAISAPHANAAVYCATVYPNNPVFGGLSSSGYKVAAAQFHISCNKKVDVEVELWGDDAANDDRIGTDTFRATTLAANRVYRGNWKRCNEDSPGNDELFSRVRIRQYASNGSVSGWSNWVKSSTVSFSC